MAGYSENRYTIPYQYSSLAQSLGSSEHEKTFLELETQKLNLSKKASELLMKKTEKGKQHHAISKEWIRIKHDLLRTSCNSYNTLKALYRSAYHANKITKSAFEDLIAGCTYKKSQLALLRFALDRECVRLVRILDTKVPGDFEGAYTKLFTEIFCDEEENEEYESRKHFGFKSTEDKEGRYYTESSWSDDLCDYYNALDPKDPDFLWCPITKEYERSSNRKCVNIVSQRIPSTTIGYLFGGHEDGVRIKWSMQNALILNSAMQSAFEKGWFVLLPLERKLNDPNERWLFYLLAKDKANERWGIKKSEGTWGMLHGSELEWKNENRPDQRFLYFHFVSSLLRYMSYEKPVWEDLSLFMDHLPTGSAWANKPGPPYLRKSLLRVMARSIIGDLYMLPTGALFQETFGEGRELEAEEEEMLGDEFLIVMEKPMVLEDFFVGGGDEVEDGWGFGI